jgi:two-component system sensor histidine kinase ChiS
MTKKTDDAEVHFVAFGYLLVIGYLAFYFFNLLIAAPEGDESLAMRVFIAVLGVGLIFKDYWPKSFRVGMPIYWHITLTYSLSFFFMLMLFRNPDSNIWQINGLVGMVTMTFFTNWFTFILLNSIGIISAYIMFHLNTDAQLPSTLLNVFGSYSAPIIYFILFSSKKEQTYEARKIEELRQVNTKLTQQAIELQKALSIKSDFLNNLSHEVKTPIGGVVTISEMLYENWEKYPDAFRYEQIRILTYSSKRLLLLMNNILDLSKFTAGKMSMEMSYSNLEKVIREMVEECRMLYLSGKKIVIEIQVEKGLNSKTIMDSERMTQVLRNILSNSIKFAPSPSTIIITLYKKDHSLYVSVHDEGIGVPENELEIIFEPFVQSSKTNTKSGGTGLGLSICKEIIEAHRGEIWAVNNPDKGITVHFFIPQVLIEEENKIEQEVVRSHSNNEVILMIDDDYTCHNAMSLLLHSEKYEMRSVYGGIEGLAYLREHVDEIDLVLLDLMMPDMYGLNVLQEIKADPRLQHLKVIIQSASHDVAERQRSFELGAHKFIAKPYCRSNVLISIRKVLDGVVDANVD